MANACMLCFRYACLFSQSCKYMQFLSHIILLHSSTQFTTEIADNMVLSLIDIDIHADRKAYRLWSIIGILTHCIASTLSQSCRSPLLDVAPKCHDNKSLPFIQLMTLSPLYASKDTKSVQRALLSTFYDRKNDNDYNLYLLCITQRYTWD